MYRTGELPRAVLGVGDLQRQRTIRATAAVAGQTQSVGALVNSLTENENLDLLIAGGVRSRTSNDVQFRDQAGVLFATLGRPEFAEVDVLVIDDHTSLTRGFVKAVGGDVTVFPGMRGSFGPEKW